ncbi:MAG: hypothetical protein PGN27_15545 [Mycolicibacterium neoaurum]|uniref:hypothetical protein n=1 Tax=Mycolicibacterium neoaurum TaxID=1795 RepID=UPI002FF81540
MLDRVAAVLGPLAGYLAGLSIGAFVVGVCMVPGALEDTGPVRDTGKGIKLLAAAIGIGDAPMITHVLTWMGIVGVPLAIWSRVRFDRSSGDFAE